LNRRIVRESLLTEMLPLVRRVALNIHRHLPAHVEGDDLTGNGILGLVDAINRFDRSKGVKLETYARHRIRGAILDGLRNADPISRDVRRKNKRIEAVYRRLESERGRTVQDEEMATALGMSLGQWHRELNEIQSTGLDSGWRVISAGRTMTLQSTNPEFLVDRRDSPFDLTYRHEQHEILSQALSRLRERERKIVTLHDQQGLTMKQIAGQMHVDESRVSQIHSAALMRLRATVNSLLQPRPAEASTRTLAMAAGAS
jgi:RNA polymerase sigma factor for flagellar operon FliA